MRPALKPGLVTVWRNRDTVQIGIDPRRAIALTGMRGAAGLLRLLDGSRDRHQVLAAAGEFGMDAGTADRVLTLLAAAGALDDCPAGGHGVLPAGTRARLAPELATASLAHRDADGGASTLARRQAARVRVHGASRAGLWIAGLLSAAGVGLVLSTGPAAPRPGPAGTRGTRPARPGPAGPRQTAPANPGPAAFVGDDADDHVPLWSPTPATTKDTRRRPDLVVLADTHRRELPAVLVRRGVPHLAASASEAIGVVGPLVLPGHSACLRCLDLARTERDPAWPLILAQLAGQAATDPLACDTVLATMVAAQAAAQALAFLDQGTGAAAAVTNGTLELVLPGWQWRRRTWHPHPQCGCQHQGW
ncbi:MAG TPA: thiamine biosynthesis protein ThiF [Streptosporangiaceae bacterium]|nr:thiamine biosynthesis protein ThiF [Streptosporangiaceae bacterium]